MSTPTSLRGALNRLRAMTKDAERDQEERRRLSREVSIRDAQIRELEWEKSRLAMCLAASDAEASHWQGKAEDLVREYVSTGRLTEFRVRAMPGAMPTSIGMADAVTDIRALKGVFKKKYAADIGLDGMPCTVESDE